MTKSRTLSGPPLRIHLLWERDMRQVSFALSVLACLLRSAVGALVTFLGSSWDGRRGKYRPEDHYMRGPGPKWREKHLLDRTSADGA